MILPLTSVQSLMSAVQYDWHECNSKLGAATTTKAHFYPPNILEGVPHTQYKHSQTHKHCPGV